MSRWYVRRTVAALAMLGTTAALGSTALAAEPKGAGAIYTKDTYPDALPSRPITLPTGMFELTVPVTANLSTNNHFKPVAVGPSLFYGINDDLTVGVYHPLLGLCVSGTDNGCPKVYNDVGAEALYSIYRQGNYQLVALADLELTQITDPTLLRARVGLEGKGTWGPYGILWGANVGFGLTNRDVGNKEDLVVFLTPQWEIARGVAIYATVGFNAPFDGFGDLFRIPVSAGLEVTPVHAIDVGATLTMLNLLGKNATTDLRVAQVYGRFRF